MRRYKKSYVPALVISTYSMSICYISSLSRRRYLSILIRDIFDHDGSPGIKTPSNLFKHNFIPLGNITYTPIHTRSISTTGAHTLPRNGTITFWQRTLEPEGILRADRHRTNEARGRTTILDVKFTRGDS